MNIETAKNLRETTALMMHHDTITGTSTQRVIDNAVQRMTKVIHDNDKVYAQELSKFAKSLGIEMEDVKVCMTPFNGE